MTKLPPFKPTVKKPGDKILTSRGWVVGVTPDLTDEAADTVEALSTALAAAERERDDLRGPVVHALASLAAAISLLERGGKKAAPSDKMFEQMLTDYRNALERARAALPAKQEPSQ